MPDVIVISSDEEENESGFTNIKTKISDKTNLVDVIDLTVNDKDCGFTLSKSKLRALKQNRLCSTRTISHEKIKAINEKSPKTDLDKSPVKMPTSPFKISPDKLNHLRPLLSIELGKFSESVLVKSPKAKKENMDDDMDTLPKGIGSPAKNKTVKSASPSPCKVSEKKQKNLLEYLKSSPKRCCLKDEFDKMKLSPTMSLETTPTKTQSTLEHWATPTKRMRVMEEPAVTPSTDISSRRNELVWPPRHVLLGNEDFIKRLYKSSRDFPTSYQYLIESLQDEELHFLMIRSCENVMSNDYAPPCVVIRNLIGIMASKKSTSGLVSMAYSLLNDILERYPTKCVAIHVTWEDIEKYLNDTRPCSRLAFGYLLSVLSVELKAGALKSKQRRLSKHFSADFNIQRVKDVISCLKKCLQNHTGRAEFLEILQNFLKLFMIVSLNKGYVAVRLADELLGLYIGLPNLEQRVLLLRSMQSHLVREHLISILLVNYCELPKAFKLTDELQLCMKKILLQDFNRKPPKRSGGLSYSAEDVEEYVTLLAYLLQSYVVIHMPSLHGYHNDYSLCYHDDVKEFSQEDLSYLKDLESYISKLQGRCEEFLKEDHHLSLRTVLLFHMMRAII
ncbi:uncharacterized protein LOC114516078 [Dendronephthya gigantea]|uniref:uncharacterized protein LOC114516078 n=1 Tax=Dendronephthya gigantea TaxID=151771 RepID=UPI00106C8816|nr:uncharacterized protein LOC114516078 [Dendronephthya gigantea]